MQVLLRNYNGTEYIWKDATYTSDGWIVEGGRVDETDIVSVKDDDRAAHVSCSVCGKLFNADDEEAWIHHITPTTDSSKCFDCQQLRIYENATKGSKIYKDEYGKYVQERITEVSLNCRAIYPAKPVDSAEARTTCIYNRCRNATKVQFEDVFTRHPGIFDNIITTDRVAIAGYKEVKRNYNGSNFLLKGKYNIVAVANNIGIIDHFNVSFRSRNWGIWYSAVTNKLFVADYKGNGKYVYSEWNPGYVSQEFKMYVLKKIASLYKEVKE